MIKTKIVEDNGGHLSAFDLQVNFQGQGHLKKKKPPIFDTGFEKSGKFLAKNCSTAMPGAQPFEIQSF